MFKPLIRATSPFVDPPREKKVTWLDAEAGRANRIRRMDRGAASSRQPVFLGLRDDKDPRDCLLPG